MTNRQMQRKIEQLEREIMQLRAEILALRALTIPYTMPPATSFPSRPYVPWDWTYTPLITCEKVNE